jgi:hypothetical protein
MARERLRRSFLALLLLAATVSVVVLAPNYLPVGADQLQRIQTATNVLLTLALVLVYLYQNSILNKQTEIMRSGYTPAVEISDVQIEDVETDKLATTARARAGNTRAVAFEVANRGNDVAVGLRVVCYLYHDDMAPIGWTDKLHQRVSGLPGFPSYGNFSPRELPLTFDDRRTEIRQSDGPDLPPSEDGERRLIGNLGVNYQQRYCSIPDAIDNLPDGTDVYLGLSLLYENAFGTTYELPMRAYKINNAESGISADEIFVSSNEYHPARQVRDDAPYHIGDR